LAEFTDGHVRLIITSQYNSLSFPFLSPRRASALLELQLATIFH